MSAGDFGTAGTADGRKIAYITGGDRLRSQLERLFITIYKLLNEKEN